MAIDYSNLEVRNFTPEMKEELRSLIREVISEEQNKTKKRKRDTPLMNDEDSELETTEEEAEYAKDGRKRIKTLIRVGRDATKGDDRAAS